MCRRLALMLAAATVAVAVRGQAPPSPPAQSAAATAREVVLDVVAQDKDGHAVHGLKPENFRITEDGVAQTIDRLEEHSSQAPAQNSPAFPALAPGIFTDYTPIAPGATLNILVIDALNTPVKNANFLRSQLQQYVKHANPNTRIAVFGLANRLILLQGLTSDPAALRDVVERKLIARSPDAAQPAVGPPHDPRLLSRSDSVASPTLPGSPSAITLAANLREFQSEIGAMETGLRPQYTLDALNTLAHYLRAFSGRKNLIWFSASFPLNLFPEPSARHPGDSPTVDEDELRETLNLLAGAHVSIYPVDARDLITASAASATAHTDHPHTAGSDASSLLQTSAAEHAVMEALASGTGGRAFPNPTSLADAVASAVAAGSDYYALAYHPTANAAAPADTFYRKLHVETTSNGQHLQLSYVQGYYVEGSKTPPVTTATEQARAAAYRQAAMSRGGPTPEDLVFRVRVLPASSTTETTAAADNELDFTVPTKGPFRRYDLDFLALPGELAYTEQPDGHRVAKVEFLANVFDTDGRVLTSTGRELVLQPITSDPAKLARSIIRYHLEISVPDRAETFLRIGMMDATTNRFGVVELPTSAVSSLPPPVYPTAPATPSTTPPSPPAPAGRTTRPQD